MQQSSAPQKIVKHVKTTIRKVLSEADYRSLTASTMFSHSNQEGEGGTWCMDDTSYIPQGVKNTEQTSSHDISSVRHPCFGTAAVFCQHGSCSCKSLFLVFLCRRFWTERRARKYSTVQCHKFRYSHICCVNHLDSIGSGFLTSPNVMGAA